MLKSIISAILLSTAVPVVNATELGEDIREMFALNLYHEARTEGRKGMRAIGWVVLNRVEDEEYPDTILDVITHKRDSSSKCEWRWWCDGRSDKPKEAELWELARDVTGNMLSANPPEDVSKGALWFHQAHRDRPSWMGDDVVKTAKLGEHVFYGRRGPN